MIKKNIFKLSFIYTGTILGAGFASGKELVTFFAVFGKYGIYGFFLSCFLIAMSGIAIMDLIKKSEAKNYREFLEKTFGKILGKILENLNLAFIFILFSAMLAGGGTTFSSISNLDFKLCTLIFGVFVFLSLFFREKALININSFLCPILIFFGIFIGIYIYFFQTSDVFNIQDNYILSSFVYTSYNIITVVSILFGVRNLILNRKVILYSGVLCGILIFLIGIFTLLPLIRNYLDIKSYELPIFFLIENKGLIKFIYTMVILMAIYTTAIGNGFALENILFERTAKKRLILRLIITTLGIFTAFFGFSDMVEKIYPIFGYLGLFQLLVIFIMYYLKEYKK